MDHDELTSGLRVILNEWDPIGVAGEVQDEYDCQIGPLLTRLRAGAGVAEIDEYLRAELRDHFGLSPWRTREAAERLVAWWSAARPQA